MSTSTPLAAGTKIVIAKGCRDRKIAKGERGSVIEVIPGDRGSARVRLHFPRGAVTVSFYVQHTNRLSDDIVGMNDGNPMHRIEIRRA